MGIPGRLGTMPPTHPTARSDRERRTTHGNPRQAVHCHADPPTAFSDGERRTTHGNPRQSVHCHAVGVRQKRTTHARKGWDLYHPVSRQTQEHHSTVLTHAHSSTFWVLSVRGIANRGSEFFRRKNARFCTAWECVFGPAYVTIVCGKNVS